MDYKDMKILVVDDVLENIQIVIESLKPLECKFFYAKNGKDCINSSIENLPDLILLDIMMPQMDGFETCKTLKQNSKTCDIPIIFLSAFDTNGEIIKGFEFGAVDYISKPFQSNELIARVQTHLKLHTLEKKLKNEVKKALNEVIKLEEDNKKKQLILMKHSKMASMGEMLENIAHQWRQPLSLISTSASGTLLKHATNTLDEEFMEEAMTNIIKSVSYLSHTLTDFKDFFQHKDDRIHFQLYDVIDKVLFLLSSKSEPQLQVIKKIEDIDYFGFENYLVQVVLNVINNALDALLNQQEEYLFIEISRNADEIHITIKDNAGGIAKENLGNIFDAYFTTKVNNDGTGIGLYMSKKIIETKFEGTILAKNVTYEYKQKIYSGAEFKIIFPLSGT